jgi:hypothetical protein
VAIEWYCTLLYCIVAVYSYFSLSLEPLPEGYIPLYEKKKVKLSKRPGTTQCRVGNAVSKIQIAYVSVTVITIVQYSDLLALIVLSLPHLLHAACQTQSGRSITHSRKQRVTYSIYTLLIGVYHSDMMGYVVCLS